MDRTPLRLSQGVYFVWTYHYQISEFRNLTYRCVFPDEANIRKIMKERGNKKRTDAIPLVPGWFRLISENCQLQALAKKYEPRFGERTRCFPRFIVNTNLLATLPGLLSLVGDSHKPSVTWSCLGPRSLIGYKLTTLTIELGILWWVTEVLTITVVLLRIHELKVIAANHCARGFHPRKINTAEFIPWNKIRCDTRLLLPTSAGWGRGGFHPSIQLTSFIIHRRALNTNNLVVVLAGKCLFTSCTSSQQQAGCAAQTPWLR